MIGPTSISELAVITAKKIYNDVQQRKVLLIGAGKTAELTTYYFKESCINNITIANRGEKRGRSLAESIGGNYIDLIHLDNVLYECDIIIVATHSKDYMIARNQIENIMGQNKDKILIIDISTPRNVDPSIHDIKNVFLYDLDHLNAIVYNNRKKNKEVLEKAAMIIQNHSRKLMKRLQLKYLMKTDLELAE